MKKIIAAVSVLLTLATHTRAEETSGVFHRSAPPKELLVIDLAGMPDQDRHLAAIIQGMANRAEPRIYLANATIFHCDEVWLPFYEKEYGIITAGSISLDEALKKFANLFKGYAVFSWDENWSLAAVDNYCSINDCLPVTPEQEQRAKDAGLEKIEDFRGRWKNAIQATVWSFENLYPSCSKKAIASLIPPYYPISDYVYQNRIFAFQLELRGRQFVLLRKILEQTPDNIPVFGYIARDVVEEFVSESALAKEGKFLIATNSTPNLSVHSGIPVRPLPETSSPGKPPDIAGKLGVVFAFSDADNLVIQTAYYLQPEFWMNPNRGKLKVAWGVAPELYELAPGIMRYYYKTRTENDFFVAMCGAGYIHPLMLPDMQFFGDLTVKFMRLSGLDVLWTLDPGVYFTTDPSVMRKFFEPFGGNKFLKGVMVGYTPSGRDDYWHVPAGYPPLLYSKSNYLKTSTADLARMIGEEAKNIPAGGKIVFYSINAWGINYNHLLDVTRNFDGRKDIVFLSPQEAFSIIGDMRSK